LPNAQSPLVTQLEGFVFVAADGQAQFTNNRRVSSLPRSSNQLIFFHPKLSDV